MSYARILVHVEDAPGCGERTALAARLALRFGSHLLGVAPSGDAHLSIGGKPAGIVSAAVFEEQRAYRYMKARGRCDAFSSQVSPFDLLSVEALVAQSLPEDALLVHGRCCDLVVIGQPPTRDDAYLARELLMKLGRPLLLVPHAGEFPDAGHRVMLAWDGGRECARAAADAMPFLQRADQVIVVQVSVRDNAHARPVPTCEEAAQWLALHRVPVQAKPLVAHGEDAGNALLSLAADENIDLMVMGGFGHAPWAETLFGGATRTVLDSMTIPVLLSH